MICGPTRTPMEIQADIADLRAHIRKLSLVSASGISRVTHGDRTVQYRSGAEVNAEMIRLQRQLAALEALLGNCSPGRVARRVLFIARKGL